MMKELANQLEEKIVNDVLPMEMKTINAEEMIEQEDASLRMTRDGRVVENKGTSASAPAGKATTKTTSPGVDLGEPRDQLVDDDWSSDEEVDVKATKRDGAQVDVKRWNREVFRSLGITGEARHVVALDCLRRWMLKWYKRHTTSTFFDWKRAGRKRGKNKKRLVEMVASQRFEWTENGKSSYQQWHRASFNGRKKETAAARDAIGRIANSTWWEWKDGSRCLHWRWPEWYQETIRDGLKVWIKKKNPKKWLRPQKAGKTKQEHEKMKAKLQLVRDRRYVDAGFVQSLTSFFAVPKGDDDIRMVYDGTKSGLNDSIWVPSFPMPTVNTMLRAVTFNTVMSDFDIGDCFLNFVLHETMQALCGIDLTKYFGEGDILWERWTRAAMGLKSSPYQAIQAIMVVKEICLGDRHDEKNAFR